jgi:hypothetical protein
MKKASKVIYYSINFTNFALKRKITMNNKYNSPYSAAITGGGFLYEETNVLLPLLQSADREALLKDELLNNRLLKINAESSRKRAAFEIRRRFDAMPARFWQDYQQMAPEDQVVALFYVILKTYKICFDFHVRVAMRKWNEISRHITKEDIMMELNEISSNDEFVDSWSDNTKDRVASAYLTILRRVKMLDSEGDLHTVRCGNFEYSLAHGENWFLEACLLPPYEIEPIKSRML